MVGGTFTAAAGQEQSVTLNGQHYDSLADAQHAGAPTLGGEGADPAASARGSPGGAEELLVEIRDILNAQTAPPRRRINQVFRPQSRPSA
jgi:hypothetical protein